jgi:hypothetical protein
MERIEARQSVVLKLSREEVDLILSALNEAAEFSLQRKKKAASRGSAYLEAQRKKYSDFRNLLGAVWDEDFAIQARMLSQR